MCTNSAHVTNQSCSFVEEKDTLFSTQDKEILSILEELEETANVSANVKLGCLVIFVQTLSSI